MVDLLLNFDEITAAEDQGSTEVDHEVSQSVETICSLVADKNAPQQQAQKAGGSATPYDPNERDEDLERETISTLDSGQRASRMSQRSGITIMTTTTDSLPISACVEYGEESRSCSQQSARLAGGSGHREGGLATTDEDEGEGKEKEEEDSVCESPPVEYSVFLSRMNSVRGKGGVFTGGTSTTLSPEPSTPSVADVIQLRYRLSPAMIEEKTENKEFTFFFPKPGAEASDGADTEITATVVTPAGSRKTSVNTEHITPLKYHLVNICTIGTGSFGQVKLARHKITEQYYALKCLYVPALVAKRQVDHVHQEKRILQLLDHPFIVKLYDTAKDRSNLYMIMEFLAGGELFSYLRASKKFPSQVVKFYTAEIILALEYLHFMSIAYRDLKLENLMLTEEGHIKLTDFGFAKRIDNKSYTLCGTPSYLAPEVISRRGHNSMVDFWALGVLTFELMVGYPPFGGSSLEDVRDSIEECLGKAGKGIVFPHKIFSPNAKDLISRLLTIDPAKRLGASSADELKQHPWFEWCDWQALYDQAITPPLIPTIYYDGDTGNFDSFAEAENQTAAQQRDLDLFDDW